MLTFGGLLLLGGRVGDAIGHKRAFLSGVGVFTIASLVCGLATDGITLIVARAVQGTGAAVAAPTGLALIATTYAVGHARNRAMAVSAAMQGVGSVLGLVLGGALTVISWRLAFLINVPIGIVIIVIAVYRIGETHHERLKLDITGALLATLGCTAAVLVFTQGPPRAWVDPWVIGAGVAAVVFFAAFLIVERTAENPLVPFEVFDNRNRVMTFVSLFLAGGVLLTLTVMIGLLVQDVLGYSALRAGISFIPFALAFGLGSVLAARIAPLIAPRWLIIGGGVFVLGAMLYGSTLTRTIPYFPDLFMPIVVGGFGIGMIAVILPLCAVAEVGPREIGPVSAITLMVQNLGGPLVLVVIQAVQTSRTLYLGGTTGPVKDMSPAQLDALGLRLHLLAAVGRRDRRAGRHRRVLDRFLRASDRHRAAHPRGGRGRRAVDTLSPWTTTRDRRDSRSPTRSTRRAGALSSGPSTQKCQRRRSSRPPRRRRLPFRRSAPTDRDI